jgi:hypothetical protein
MHEEESLRAVAFNVRKIDDGWMITLPDKTLLGPYQNGEVALEVAVTHALLARNEGIDAHIYVEDDRGGHHSCMIVDHMNDPHRCAKCEASWSSAELPVTCRLRAAISSGN